MITLKDIAKVCNVSVATVSIVLSNRPHRFSSTTVNKVIETAKALNYVPNTFAQSLITKRTRIIGLIVPDVNNIFFLDFITEAERVAKKRGYTVVLVNSENDVLEELNNYKTFIARRFDATIILRASLNYVEGTQELTRFANKYKMPTLCMCRNVRGSSVLNIYLDDVYGSYQACQYLIETGHKKIGFIGGPFDVSFGKLRLEGFLKALKEAHYNEDQYVVLEGDFGYQSGTKNAKLLLEVGCDSIFAANDMMAIGAYQAVIEAGKLIGEEISIIGYDDIRFGAMLIPSLTTIHQPMKSMADEGVTALIDFVEGKNEETFEKEYEPSLVIRKSVKVKM